LQTHKIGALPEWAFFTSITIVLFLALFYVPFFELLAKVLLPLPFVLLVLRLDTRYAALSLVVAGACLFYFAPGYTPALLLFLPLGLLGILFGLLYKNRVAPLVTLAAGLGLSALLTLLSAWLLDVVKGIKLFIIDQDRRIMLEQILTAYSNAGAFNNMSQEMQSGLYEKVMNFYEIFLPGQYIIEGAFFAGLAYFMSRAMLGRMRYSLSPLPPFSEVRCPWYIVWSLILGLGLTLAGDYSAQPLVEKIGKNILFVFFYVYLVLGLSVVIYIARRIKIPGVFKAALLILGLIYLPFSITVLLLCGIVDPLTDLRNLPEADG
jgi:uncharacterized protein YybS (DUF2232 family)